jgi:hypothetical protein
LVFPPSHAEAAALARIAIAAKTAEPVTWWTGPEPTSTGEREGFHDHETGGHEIPLVQALYSYPVRDYCRWTYDEHDYKWDSACGEAWQFTDGGPEDNGVKFCQGCGKPVVLPPTTEK